MTSIGFLTGCLASLLVGVGFAFALSMVRNALAAKTLHRAAGLAFWVTATLPLALPCIGWVAGAMRPMAWWTVAGHFLPDALPAQAWLVDIARAGVAMLAAAALIKVARFAAVTRRIARTAERLRRTSGPGGAAVAADVPGPLLLGYRRPVVVLPTVLMALPSPVVDALVRHELAHARRRDNWRLLAEHLAMASLPWCLPLKSIHDAMLAAREELCDREALADTDDATREGYARALVEVLRRTSIAPVGASAMAGHLPVLQRRLSAIVDPCFALPSLSLRRAGVAIATFVMASAATCGACQLGFGASTIAGEQGLSMRFVAEAEGGQGAYRVTTLGGSPGTDASGIRAGTSYRMELAQDGNGTWRVTLAHPKQR